MSRFNSQRVQQRRAGSALMSAAVAAGVLGIMVVSYLAWITNEYRMSVRSHAWSQALSLCEAGVELALAEYNYVYVKNPGSAFRPSDGWVAGSSTTSVTRKVNNFKDSTGRTVGSFVVTIENLHGKYPIILSTAEATASGKPVSRSLRVVARSSKYFRFALVAKDKIELTSNSSTIIDSFDSGNIYESTNGQYDPAKRTPRGNVSTLSSGSPAIRLKNTQVYGVAKTAPGGVVTFHNSGVGATTDPSQRSTSQANAESKGWITHDFVMDIPNVVVPPALTSATSLGDIAGNRTFNAGDYRMTRLRNTSGNIIINGQVRLYVQGDVVFSGSSTFEITPGSSVEVYVTGSVTVGGGGVVNTSGKAANNLWFGTTTSSSWSLSGNGSFVGVGYAPQAVLSLGGNPNYMGAFVAREIDIGGGGGVHYDEALGRGINVSAYSVLSWQPLVMRNGAWVIETN